MFLVCFPFEVFFVVFSCFFLSPTNQPTNRFHDSGPPRQLQQLRRPLQWFRDEARRRFEAHLAQPGEAAAAKVTSAGGETKDFLMMFCLLFLV